MTKHLVPITVPFDDIAIHLDGSTDASYSWFARVGTKRDDRGHVLAILVAVTDEEGEYSIQGFSDDNDPGLPIAQQESAAKLKLPVVGWKGFNGMDPMRAPVVEVTQEHFAAGLATLVTKNGQLSEYSYIGEGEWDIDANGYDCILQMAIFGELIFG
jgi:hypothetical protein